MLPRSHVEHVLGLPLAKVDMTCACRDRRTRFDAWRIDDQVMVPQVVSSIGSPAGETALPTTSKASSQSIGDGVPVLDVDKTNARLTLGRLRLSDGSAAARLAEPPAPPSGLQSLSGLASAGAGSLDEVQPGGDTEQ